MAAEIYNFTIEKGVDFSISLVLQKTDGTFVDLTNSNVCVKSEIVEFYGLSPITGFSVSEVLPSGVILSLNEEGTKKLPFGECYYDVILNTNGVTERLMQGTITTSESSTENISCQ